MRSLLLVAGLGLALALTAHGATGATPAAHAGAPGAQATQPGAAKGNGAGLSTWIVLLDDAPVAAYRAASGERATKSGLAATSPLATGTQRLDARAPASKAYAGFLADQRRLVLEQGARQLGRALQPLHVYAWVLNGMALQLDPREAALLRAQPGVASVSPDFQRQLLTDAGPAWINADEVWTAGGNLGNRGEGVVVGIIDSGINRTHPAFAQTGPVDGYQHANPLGQRFGLCAGNAALCNDKLIGIYDFSDEGAGDGSDVSGHGSHVAGTAVGNHLANTIDLPGGGVARPISGVAPHANLISYKACREDDPDTDAVEACRGSWLVAAIDQAVADGVDIINYSIGGIDAFGPWQCSGAPCGDELALLNAFEAGVLPVVAAGNEGPHPRSVTSPGDAPWVLSVANASHDRFIVNRLVGLVGGAGSLPGGGVLAGAGLTSGSQQAAIVFPSDHPDCAIGSGTGLDANGNPDGSTNPWAGGGNRFNGEIVVCLRGTQARIAKSDNVRREGAGGFVLVNTAAEAESIVADPHSLPGTHLGYRDGAELLAWLATGSGHRGRIEGTTVQLLPEAADVLSASSGRGPARFGPYLLPDVTAPGTSIIAAAGSGAGVEYKSGTSMAAPHVAGAAALLKAAHPGWTPSDLASALVTTARPSALREDAVTPAGVFAQGSGVVDAGAALHAGLSFRTSASEYRNASPALGGDTSSLNEPALLHSACLRSCALGRRVTDLAGGGSWRVVAELPEGAQLTATPAQFTLAPGASQQLQFQIDVSDPRLAGDWVEGRVRFERTDSASAPDASIPLAVFADPGALPGPIQLTTAAQSGFEDLALSGLVALPDARFGATALATVQRREGNLAQDQSRNDPYDNLHQGVMTQLVTVPAAAGVPMRLVVQTASATASDVDLFVGVDANGDGLADREEEVCRSTSAGSNERCEVAIAGIGSPQTYWTLAQNWQSGGSTDEVVLESAVVDMRPDPDSVLTVTGPGHTDADAAFSLRISWDDPSLLPGSRRRGFVLLGAHPDRLGDTAAIPVTLARSTPGSNAAAVLVPGQPYTTWLAPGAAQDRLFVDVPPSAARMTISTTGAGQVELHAARIEHPPASGQAPGIAAAPPRDQAQASSTAGGANQSITVQGAALQAGRWYVTPVNTGTGPAQVQITIAMEYAAQRPDTRFGAWFNPARSGAGVFLYRAAEDWSLFWYTFLQDGTPVWYLGSAPAPGPQQALWSVRLGRYAWNGESAGGTEVGEATLSLHDPERFIFSWTLDGEGGSEPYQWIDGGACPAAGPLTGSWYAPSASGYGFSVNAYAGLESNAAYIYDGLGQPRWVFGSAGPFGTDTLPMSQYQGACALCTYVAPGTTEVGSYVRSYEGDDAGTAALELELAAPLSGTWSTLAPIIRITHPVECE